jgi:hypothetical protein
MKRSTRPALAAALAVSVAFGIAAPASAAAHSAHGVHAKADGHGPKHDGRDDKKSDDKKSDKESKKVASEKRKVARDTARKDDALARFTKDARRLDADFEQAVLANVAGDRSLLAELDTALEAATTLAEVRAVDDQVESLRPELYKQVVGDLRRAERIVKRGGDQLALIEELTVAAEAQADGAVLTLLAEARAHNDQATAAFDPAIATVLGLTAVSGKRAEKDAEVALKSVEALLRQADGEIEAAQEALGNADTGETEPAEPSEPTEPAEPAEPSEPTEPGTL